MYIKINGKRYPCTWYTPRSGAVVYAGVEGLELPVEGMVTLYADDGFELAVQDAGDYARQVYDGGVLTLTNEPEPVPDPEPPEPPVDEITALQLAIAELAEAQAADTLAIQLAIAELAEALLGGE